jgi:ABC-type Na+ efflux pump permease subunit
VQSIVEVTSNLLAQQWSILSAYFAVIALFQFRNRHLPLNMARVARHAIWAAGLVVTVHSLSREVKPLAFESRVFAGTVHVLVTVLGGALLYQLGCLFEKKEEPQAVIESES